MVTSYKILITSETPNAASCATLARASFVRAHYEKGNVKNNKE